MGDHSNESNGNSKISRRNFVKFGGVAIAGSTLNLSSIGRVMPQQEETEGVKINEYRILGRTGFKVSDIGMGTNRNIEPNLIRYAYDKGINCFDTAEGYGNGRSERTIGKALKFMDRKKVFITTKIHVKEDETEESIIERFRRCLERLQSEYIDAFFMHNITDVNLLQHSAYHGAVKQLKSEGRLKHTGLSCHGPRGGEGDSLEKVLCAAAEDGRFDLMLFVYNFMNKEEGDKILAACKKHNVGATAMKTSPGVLKVEPVDPENLTQEQEEYVRRLIGRGTMRENAIERLQRRRDSQKENHEKSRPFIEKYGIKTAEQLRRSSIHWVAQNPNMHTTCVSFIDFDFIDKIVPISGTKLSHAEWEFLEEFKLVYNNQYCRHGCIACVVQCPYRLPVSTIMRYAYYYECQGREKEALQKYMRLNGCDAAYCMTCDAPCLGSCPFGVDIQANLVNAHLLLTLA